MAGRWGRNFQELQRRVMESGARGATNGGGGGGGAGGRGGFFGAAGLVGLGGFYLLSVSMYNGAYSPYSLAWRMPHVPLPNF
jgi:hypothetical protein